MKYKIFENSFIYIFVFVIISSIFLNYFHYDEAWYYFRVNNYSNTGYFTGFGEIQNPFQKVLLYIYYLINPDTSNPKYYFINRTLSLLTTLISLRLLYKILNEKLLNLRHYFFYSFLFFTFWFSFHSGGISSRPDSIVSFFVCLSLYLLYFPNLNLLIGLTLLNIIFISIHPNMLFLIPLNFFLIWKNKRSIDLKKVIFFFILLIIAIFLSFHLIKFNLNSQEFLKLYDKFFVEILTSNFEKSENFFSLKGLLSSFIEDITLKGRFGHLRNFHPFTYNLFLLVYILVFLVFIKFLLNKNPIDKNFFIFFYLNSLLFIAPNKWLHHFSIVIPPLLLIIPICLNELKIKKILESQLLRICLIFLIITNLYINYKSNFFFNKIIKESNLNLNFSLFNKNDYLKISKINNEITDINFAGNPEFNYVFSKGNFLGNNFSILNQIPILVILEANSECKSLNNKFQYLKNEMIYKKFEDFNYERKSYKICRLQK